ncbi:type II toxin-antitoxin system Phd/YefM family antitoxin [Hyphomonas sp.]|jgi:prevent-host-death family protein|uniref:type II toxin-antitoxin system Phd/YefM family antitoxin n=1 Tax=Hyphomonas sp. TaxID=87 RepID=UPI0037C19F33
MTVREANQNFSQLIAAAERGEVIVITSNGVPVARVAPEGKSGRQDCDGNSDRVYHRG